MTTPVEHIKYYLIGAFLVFIVLYYFTMQADKRELSYQFSGVVQIVTDDDKGYSTVVIDNEKYILGHLSWNFNSEIDQGDSLIKKRGSFVIKLIKNKTGEVLYFK